jgi:hypothetical protein
MIGSFGLPPGTGGAHIVHTAKANGGGGTGTVTDTIDRSHFRYLPALPQTSMHPEHGTPNWSPITPQRSSIVHSQSPNDFATLA